MIEHCPFYDVKRLLPFYVEVLMEIANEVFSAFGLKLLFHVNKSSVGS